MNIWVNGCFDILHSGHIDLLWFAKMYKSDSLKKNRLIVGLDSDERVKLLKGNNRPINDISTRKKIMENLIMVDYVIVFNSDDELRNAIKSFSTDYVIVGDQYKNKEVIGSENAKFGADFYPVDEHSTTNIINKIKEL